MHSRTLLDPNPERLSMKDIQNITSSIINLCLESLIKDTRAHRQNIGVISSIKGKMYCLKLGQMQSSKEFSHYFYVNLYKRRMENV
jgi:hypothetical protein